MFPCFFQVNFQCNGFFFFSFFSHLLSLLLSLRVPQRVRLSYGHLRRFSGVAKQVFVPPLKFVFQPFHFDWSLLTSALSGKDAEPSLHRQACVRRNQRPPSKRTGGPWGRGDRPLAETSLKDATRRAGGRNAGRGALTPSIKVLCNRLPRWREQTQAGLPEESGCACLWCETGISLDF